MPATVWLWVEDLDRQTETQTVQPGQDGSLEILLPVWDPALQRGVQVGDRLAARTCSTGLGGADLGVVPLEVWLLPAGNGAVVGAGGGAFTTDAGVTVGVPAGALPDGATVQATLVDPAAALPRRPRPARLRHARRGRAHAVGDGRRVARADDPRRRAAPCRTRSCILARIVDIGGVPYPMLVSTARWDAALGAYRTGPPAAGALGAELGQAAGAAAAGPLAAGAMSIDPSHCDRLNAVITSGTHALLDPTNGLGLVAGQGASGVVITNGGWASDPDVYAGHTFSVPSTSSSRSSPTSRTASPSSTPTPASSPGSRGTRRPAAAGSSCRPRRCPASAAAGC